jgi:hypothetical protein
MSKYEVGDELELIKDLIQSMAGGMLYKGDRGTVETVRYDHQYGLNEYVVRMQKGHQVTLHDDELDTWFRLVISGSDAARKNMIAVPRVLYKWYKDVDRVLRKKS